MKYCGHCKAKLDEPCDGCGGMIGSYVYCSHGHNHYCEGCTCGTTTTNHKEAKP